MLNDKKQQLKKKAKQHKKLFESYKIEEKFIYLEDKEIYMVFYVKFKRSRGIALISPQPDISIETYNRALENLVLLYTTTGSINVSGGSRARINFKPFHQVKTFLEQVLRVVKLSRDEKEHFQCCYQTLKENIKLQEELKQLYDDFLQAMEVKRREGFTVIDIDYMLDILVEMDYIQYTQLRGNYKTMTSYQYVLDSINQNRKIKALANNNSIEIIKTLAGSKEKLLKEIQSISHFNNMDKLSKKEHMEKLKQQIISEQNEANKKIIKEMRFPNLG